jgi:hypothetical protein
VLMIHNRDVPGSVLIKGCQAVFPLKSSILWNAVNRMVAGDGCMRNLGNLSVRERRCISKIPGWRRLIVSEGR